jgi:hypothetical protein
MIGTWPDPDAHATFLKSDASADLLVKLAPLINRRFVHHVQVGEKKVPIDAPILSVEFFSVETDVVEVFEKKVNEAEKTVSKKTAPYTVAGGFDIRESSKKKFAEQYEKVKEAVGLADGDAMASSPTAATENLKWVSFSGWKDEEEHLVSVKEIVSPYAETRVKVSIVPNVFDTIHMKLIMS